MIYTRTPINLASAVSLLDVKDHLRVDHSFDEVLIERMAASVALEFEDLCNIALLSQTITATSAIEPGTDLELPVGPVAAGASITVQALAEDGTTTAITAFWLAYKRGKTSVAADPAGTGRRTGTTADRPPAVHSR